MEDLELKYITELAQMRDIVKNNCELAHHLLEEHSDLCGVVSVSDYNEIIGIPKRTIQDRLKNGSIPHIDIGGFRLPCINL